MAQSLPLGGSINLGSDHVPENYCQPCYDITGDIKPAAGYCLNCDEGLCGECYSFHLRTKPYRNHQLQVDKPKRTQLKLQAQPKHHATTEKCPRHHGETLQSFCKSHSQICCKVCLTINHQTCDTEDISKMARNIKTSGQQNDLKRKLSMLKKGFNENLSKTEANRSTTQSNYSQARDEMKKLSEEFDKLMTETEKQAEAVKEEDLALCLSVSERCSVIIDQINKITSNLDKVADKGDNESIFISMKRAENELQSFEESLSKLVTDNTIREYKFESDMKLKDLMSQLKVLGNLSFLPDTHTSATCPSVSISQQLAKKPTSVKDIKVHGTVLYWHGLVNLPNKQILVTDYRNKKVKHIDTSNGLILSMIQVSDNPVNITKMESDTFAVLLNKPNKIQILNLSQNKLLIDKEISISEGDCYGIAYNNKDHKLVVAFSNPGKLEIINMDGNVERTIETYLKGSNSSGNQFAVAMIPDMNRMYVTDYNKSSVALLSLDGDVQAVYKDESLLYPEGICVHKSGVVYVVGFASHTVNQLDPDSGELKLLLDQKDGLEHPCSICYCEEEDKMYVGLYQKTFLKVFEMK